MAVFTQLPGTLDVTFVKGDEVNIALDFDINLTGYTISNAVYVANVIAGDGGGASFVTTPGATVATFTVTNVDLSLGKISIGLNETQTGALSPAIAYRWYLRWVAPGAITRTVLSGSVTVVSP